MKTEHSIVRQLMDWRAAIIAGIVAGVVFLMVNMWLASAYLGNANLPLQLSAALVLGKSVLPPAVQIAASAYLVGLVVHFALAIVFACIVAFCLYQWGIWTGIIGGALFGLAMYAINYYAFAEWFPWFTPMRSWIMALSHAVYGAVAGGVYEALERERFERVPA
jgi:hypothetical protein